jgi:hypothetical protein
MTARPSATLRLASLRLRCTIINIGKTGTVSLRGTMNPVLACAMTVDRTKVCQQNYRLHLAAGCPFSVKKPESPLE